MLRRRPVARRAVRTAAVVGTAAAVGGHMAAKQQASAAQQQQQAPPQQDVVTAAPGSPVGISPDEIEQLKQLAGMKDQGILSEEEFAAEKAKILGF